MAKGRSQQYLVDLGLTGLEAEVFTFLLTESPATGYRVAQAIGKPAANTYKAIESLEKKGAVLVERGANRLCRAVSPDELLAGIERRFLETKKRAQAALATVDPPADDDHVYAMKTRRQVLERCRSMLARASEVALVDAFPEPLASLRADIEESASRGVSVYVKAYATAEIRGAGVALFPGGRLVLERWPGHWINVVVDGGEYLLAFLTPDGDGVHQAVWSNSAYLSWVYHSSLAAEIAMAEVQGILDRGGGREEIRECTKRFGKILVSEAPGYRSLVRRFTPRGSQRRGAGKKEA